jgi:hypothetical protein
MNARNEKQRERTESILGVRPNLSTISAIGSVTDLDTSLRSSKVNLRIPQPVDASRGHLDLSF